MRIRHILALGVVVNLGLMGGVVWQAGRGPAVAARAVVSAPAATGETNLEEQFPPVPPGFTNVVVQRAFRWSDVESDDYLELIANLRAAGCPETTIQDIVIARAEDDFAARRWELLRPLSLEFWDRLAKGEEPPRFDVSDELERSFNELRERSRKVLARLREELTVDAEATQSSDDSFWNFLPPGKAAAARALRQQLVQRTRELNRSDQPGREAARAKLVQESDEAMRALLDAAEWAEYELRRGGAVGWLRSARGLDLNEAEMRALALRWQTNQIAPGSLNSVERRAHVAAVIGEARADEFSRNQSGDDEMFQRVARRHGLPADVARRAAAVRAAAEREAAAIRERGYPTEEIRARAAAALLLGVNAELAGIYGEQAWPTLEKYGMGWREQLFPDESGDSQ